MVETGIDTSSVEHIICDVDKHGQYNFLEITLVKENYFLVDLNAFLKEKTYLVLLDCVAKVVQLVKF